MNKKQRIEKSRRRGKALRESLSRRSTISPVIIPKGRKTIDRKKQLEADLKRLVVLHKTLTNDRKLCPVELADELYVDIWDGRGFDYIDYDCINDTYEKLKEYLDLL